MNELNEAMTRLEGAIDRLETAIDADEVAINQQDLFVSPDNMPANSNQNGTGQSVDPKEFEMKLTRVIGKMEMMLNGQT